MKTRGLIALGIFVGFMAAMLLNSANAVSTADPGMEAALKRITELEANVLELQKKMDTLESAVKVTPSSVTVQSNGNITIQAAATLNLKAAKIQQN